MTAHDESARAPIDIELVLAVDSEWGIGRDGGIPWRVPEDMAHFRTLTTAAPPGMRNAVVMGRVTWASLPERFRPLPNRLNVVLSRGSGLALPADVRHARSLDDALSWLGARSDVARVFVIGGAAVYDEAMSHPSCSVIHLTEIGGDHACDVRLQNRPRAQGFVSSERTAWKESRSGVGYAFVTYIRRDVSMDHGTSGTPSRDE